MKRTKKEIIEQTEVWLNERWWIATEHKDASPSDMSYYNGAIKALEFLGYSWKRNEDGKHTIL